MRAIKRVQEGKREEEGKSKSDDGIINSNWRLEPAPLNAKGNKGREDKEIAGKKVSGRITSQTPGPPYINVHPGDNETIRIKTRSETEEQPGLFHGNLMR